ncbi:hypothetical protein F4703DRAFT_1864759 [Phycomyces blakesleeanus]
MTTQWPLDGIPLFPNELLMQIISFTSLPDKITFLFVNRYTYWQVSQQVYRKAIFPDSATTDEIVCFCQKHGKSLETIKLPQGHAHSDAFFTLLLELCPSLNFLQSSITPKQLNRLLLPSSSACFMLTHVPCTDLSLKVDAIRSDHYSLVALPCCSSSFVFPSQAMPPDNTDGGSITHISHYFHHPGALQNAILPTFGPDLISFTLNPYDILTASVARLIVSKCPRLRYLVAPAVKAEGLWMLLRWCHSLVTIVVGDHSQEQLEEEDDDEEEEAEAEADAEAEDEREEENVEGVEEGERTSRRRDRDRVGGRTHLGMREGMIHNGIRHRNDNLPSIRFRHCVVDEENARAVATIEHHRRVWCVHRQDGRPMQDQTLWHIGIIPKA